MLRRPSFDSWIFLAILLLGATLRLYNFSDLSLGNDELSVLARVQYDTVEDLIELGVKPDVHPLGIQLFAFYWVCVFGESELALRFPFIIAGLLSIYVLFQLGKKWFGVETALFASAAFATLQYSITLTVYARPYAMVVCFVLAMTWCWHTFVFEKGGLPALLGYCTFASLSMYFHYFSFLLVGVVGLLGILLVSAEKRKHYLFALLAIGILYLPHLSIFLHHLNMGGSGWIGKPEPGYLFSYLAYVFHFSPALIGITALLFLSSLVFFFIQKDHKTSGEARYRQLSLGFFIFPFLVGYIYSVWKAPVMHTGGLFFSFPFFLLFIFSFLPKLSKAFKLVGLLLFLLTSVISLVYERNHFTLFYNRSAEEIVKQMRLHEESIGAKKTVYLLQVHDPYYADYYLKDANLAIAAYNLDSFENITALRGFLKNRKEDYLSLGWLSRPLPPHFIPIVREYYPHMKQRKNYFISEYYVFSKDAMDAHLPEFQSKTDFESENSDWKPLDIFKQDTLVAEGNYSGFLSAEQVFGPTLHTDLLAISKHEYEEIWISCKAKLEDPSKDLQLVLQISSEKGSEVWRSAKVAPFLTEKGSWNSLHFMSRIQHLELGQGPHRVKAYLWNPGKANVWFDNLEIRLESGNPNLYGLVEPLYK